VAWERVAWEGGGSDLWLRGCAMASSRCLWAQRATAEAALLGGEERGVVGEERRAAAGLIEKLAVLAAS
jgi:hypothetical protein